MVEIAKGLVVIEQGFIDFGQSFGKGFVREEEMSHLNEGFNQGDTHFDRLWAVENIGDH